MYSRAARKFLLPDADHANPNLGPGCYTADEASLIAGKTLGEDGYAPFSSLAPRVSYFQETVVYGPSPGAYDPPTIAQSLQNTHKSALFGKSKAPRFKQSVSNTPGPGAYVIPGSLRKKKNGTLATDHKNGHGIEGVMMLTPVAAALSTRGSTVAKKSFSATELTTDKTPLIDNTATDSSIKPHSADVKRTEYTDEDVAKILSQNRVATGSKKTIKKSKKMEFGGGDGNHNNALWVDSNKPAIVWRRKYVPPSIPVGTSAFGYQENENGELVPRKPPKKSEDPGPAYNFVTSFVEKAKHERHGYRFAKEEKGLKFKITESPGPGMYDIATAENFLKSHNDTGNGPAVMTLAPCTRMTDAIVADALKKAVPGPGAYDSKINVKNPRMCGTNIPGFGGTSNHLNATNYIPSEQMKTPGPGAYYPEFSMLSNKAPNYKPQPFGSTTNRFDNSAEVRSKHLPAPGSYDLEEIDSLIKRIQKRVNVTLAGAQPKAFGSVSERFRYSTGRESKAPGPGAYDITEIPPAPSNSSKPSKRGTVMTGLAQRVKTPASPSSSDPTHPAKKKTSYSLYKNVQFDPTKVRIPVFGSQTDRFPNSNHEDLPPPGAYEIAQAFQTLKTKGRIEKPSILASQMPRELFKVQTNIPGPGEYDSSIKDSKMIRTIHNGGFLSSETRFVNKGEQVPGPGAYLSPEYDNGLIKKTYNITLTDYAVDLRS